MKRVIFILLLSSLLAACSTNASSTQDHPAQPKSTERSAKTVQVSRNSYKPDIHKKYPGLKLMTIPESFRGTWYRSDAYSKKARKLVISKHIVNDEVMYEKIGNFKLDHNSEKQNKIYSGSIAIGSVSTINNQICLRTRDVLGTVDLIYIPGSFQGYPCLYLAYSSGDIHSAIFKDPQTAIKYRKYDFSKID